MACIQKKSEAYSSQKGSALIYILVAIALLAALTASFMRPSSQQTSAQSGFKAVSELKSQIAFIRSSIQECVLKYPSGDRGVSGTAGLLGTPNTPYPINPSSTYLTSPSANDEVSNISCPRNPWTSTDQASIFAGRSGKFLPPPPNLFDAWEYYSGVNGVFFYTQTDKTDAFLQGALAKLDEEYSECEADVIDATGGEIELTSTATADDPKCPNGSTCFRVWIISQASAVYNGDADGEETAASCP